MENIVNGYLISPLQKRAWDLKREGKAFNNLLGIEISGTVDKEKLAASFNKIVQKHEIFRTTYLEQADFKYPLQIVSEEGIFELREEDVSAMANGPRLDWIQQFQQLLVTKHFNIDTAGVLGACLVKLASTSHILYIFCPAVASDIDTLFNVVDELRHNLKSCTICVRCTAACKNNTAAENDADSIQFIQYSEWQNQMSDEYNEEAVSFWREAANPQYTKEKIAFQTDHGNAPGSNKLAVVQVPLDKEKRQLVENYINAAGKNKAGFVLASWVALVWHHLGFKQEVVVGKTVTGRWLLDAFKDINGTMTKVVPFLCKIPGHYSLEQLYKKIIEQEEKIATYQDNFDCNDSLAGKHEYTDISFENYVQFPGSELLGEMVFSAAALEAHPDTFKIKLSLVEGKDDFSLALKFNTRFFSAESVKVLADQLVVLMINMAQAPTKPIDELLVISQREREMVLNQFNNTDVLFPPATIIDLFEEQVQKTPSKEAISAKNEVLNYEILNDAANRVAGMLTTVYGIKKGDIVAVKMKRSALMVAAILGVMKSGAVFLPIDSNIPDERFLFLTEDSKCAFLLTDTPIAVATGKGVEVITLKDIAALQQYSVAGNLNKPLLTDPAYVIYTSGSTGKPKGTIISHGAFANYLQWVKTKFVITESDRTLFFLSAAFDLGYTSMWPTLISGSTLCILEETPHLEPDRLIEELIAQKVTFIKLTPSHFSLLTEDPAFDTHAAQYALRLIILGGEKIKTRDIEKYLQYRKDTVFVNHYGPTETTVGVIAGEIDTQHFESYIQTPVIGKPIANNKVFILNEANMLAPIGISGEICISGAGVSDGYLGRTDLTAEKFVTNPLYQNQVMYKTGDVGRWLADGRVQLIGRNDSQVKIRGFRVETGEVEKVLLQDAATQSALVLAVEDEAGDLYLKAFVIPQTKTFDISSLKDRVSRQLPDYMMPASFIKMDEFPLLPNGKINRKVLLTIKDTQMESEINYEAPKPGTEETVAAIWQKILQKDTVSANVNFFNIGGNSLKLVKVFRELSKLYPGRLTLTELFKYSTIQAISEYLDSPDETAVVQAGSTESVVEGFDF
jgi:amino acid adenylation domain-containing protein